MKTTIEIECPDGYKPVYNAETRKVEIVPISSIERIKSLEDAINEMGMCFTTYMEENQSIKSLAKLQLIIDALNKGHKFGFLTGTIWYPLMRFYRVAPKEAKIIGHFSYKNEKFALVGAATDGASAGLGAFNSIGSIGYSWANCGMFACKSKEIAEYVSTQFGKLVFEACFAKHFNAEEFKWLD